MQVGRPGQGTGAAEAAPHRRPNWVAMLTDVKKAAVAGGSSALTPGYQTRPLICRGEPIVAPELIRCQYVAMPTAAVGQHGNCAGPFQGI